MAGIVCQGDKRLTWAKYAVDYTEKAGLSATVTLNYDRTKKAASAYTIQNGTFKLTNSATKTIENLAVGDCLVNISTSNNTSTSGSTLYKVTANGGRSWIESSSSQAVPSHNGQVYGYSGYTMQSDGTFKFSGSPSWRYFDDTNNYVSVCSNNPDFNNSSVSAGPHSTIYTFMVSYGEVTCRKITATKNTSVKITYTPYTLTGNKGAYIGEVKANEGTYPDNGIKDGYWYAKLLDTPTTWKRYSTTQSEAKGTSFTRTFSSTEYVYRATGYTVSGKQFVLTSPSSVKGTTLAVDNYLVQSGGELAQSSGDTLLKVNKVSGYTSKTITFEPYTIVTQCGNYIDTVTSYNPYEFPDNGAQDGYWYEKA
jgi:hypothetical protein